MTINNATIVGRLGRDIEIKQTNNGKVVANFGLAVNDSYNKDVTHWLDCVAWGKTAELLAKYTKKGSQIGINGNLQTREWDDKSGSKRKATEINVRDIQFLDSKQDGQQQKAADPFVQSTPPAKASNFDINDDNLPF